MTTSFEQCPEPSCHGLRRAERRWLLLLVLAFSSACGSDDEQSSGTVGPSGPVELEVSGFLNDQGERFERDSDPVTLSCAGGISVLLGPLSEGTLTNWLLRPPGACGNAPQCGYISLTFSAADGSRTQKSSATTTIVVDIGPGSYRLEAELMTGAGEPFMQDGEPVKDTLEGLELRQNQACSGTASGGASGTGGSSTSAGGTGSGAGGTGTGTGGSAGAGSGGAGLGGAGGEAGAPSSAGAAGQPA